MTVSWTKTWSASDDGTVFGGANLGTLQSDIEDNTVHLTGAQTIAGDKTFTGTIAGLGYGTTFTSSSLTAGVLTVTHNLGVQYVIASIYDNNGKLVMPDEFTATSTTVLTVDLSSYGTISGTWNVRVST